MRFWEVCHAFPIPKKRPFGISSFVRPYVSGCLGFSFLGSLFQAKLGATGSDDTRAHYISTVNPTRTDGAASLLLRRGGLYGRAESDSLVSLSNIENGPGFWNPALDPPLLSDTNHYCAGGADGAVDGTTVPAGGACVAAGGGLSADRSVNLKCWPPMLASNISPDLDMVCTSTPP